MDGFDDLLAPSRAALEQNPFADPFGNRPSSPDPWSSFHPASAPTLSGEPTAFDDVRSTTPTIDTPAFSGVPASGFHAYEDSEDPLESSKIETSDEVVPEPQTPTDPPEATSPRSPGFRESIPTALEETMSLADSERKPSPPPIVSPPLSSAPSLSSVPPSVVSPPMSPVEPASQASPVQHTSRASTSSFTSSFAPQRTSLDQTFVSPLEQPQSIERSFAGLALGGESVNGWQGSQSMFVAPPKPQAVVDEDDDDDDKPIMQARMSLSERVQATSVPVSA